MNRTRSSKQSSKTNRAKRSRAAGSNREFRHCSRSARPNYPGLSLARTSAGGIAVAPAPPRQTAGELIGFSPFHGPV